MIRNLSRAREEAGEKRGKDSKQGRERGRKEKWERERNGERESEREGYGKKGKLTEKKQEGKKVGDEEGK